MPRVRQPPSDRLALDDLACCRLRTLDRLLPKQEPKRQHFLNQTSDRICRQHVLQLEAAVEYRQYLEDSEPEDYEIGSCEDRPNLQRCLVQGANGSSPYQEPRSGRLQCQGAIVLCDFYQAD